MQEAANKSQKKHNPRIFNEIISQKGRQVKMQKKNNLKNSCQKSMKKSTARAVDENSAYENEKVAAAREYFTLS